ncbi:MAG: hypothetical protein AB8G05_00885 [Oligoflexales bacterium]
MNFLVLFVFSLISFVPIAYSEPDLDRKRIIIILSPSDGELWSDKITDGFSSELFTTKLKFSRHIVGWSFDQADENILNTIIQLKPDLVFFPNDQVYRRFSKKLPEKTEAGVMFTSCIFDKSELSDLSAGNEMGVLSLHPTKYLIEQAKKIKPIETLGIVSGTIGQEGSIKIKESLKGVVDVELAITDNIDLYRKKSQQFAKKYDAVMPISPLGIKDSQGNWISNE